MYLFRATLSLGLIFFFLDVIGIIGIQEHHRSEILLPSCSIKGILYQQNNNIIYHLLMVVSARCLHCTDTIFSFHG